MATSSVSTTCLILPLFCFVLVQVAQAQSNSSSGYLYTDFYSAPAGVSNPSTLADCDRLQQQYDQEAARIQTEHQACLDGNKQNVEVPPSQEKVTCSRSMCQHLHEQMFRAQDDAARIASSVKACYATWSAQQQKIADDAAKAEAQKEVEQRRREAREREGEERKRDDAARRAHTQAEIDAQNRDTASKLRDAELEALARRNEERRKKMDELDQQYSALDDNYENSVNKAADTLARIETPAGHTLGGLDDDTNHADYDVAGTDTNAGNAPNTGTDADVSNPPSERSKRLSEFYDAVADFAHKDAVDLTRKAVKSAIGDDPTEKEIPLKVLNDEIDTVEGLPSKYQSFISGAGYARDLLHGTAIAEERQAAAVATLKQGGDWALADAPIAAEIASQNVDTAVDVNNHVLTTFENTFQAFNTEDNSYDQETDIKDIQYAFTSVIPGFSTMQRLANVVTKGQSMLQVASTEFHQWLYGD